jgi:hypothetical protein
VQSYWILESGRFWLGSLALAVCSYTLTGCAEGDGDAGAAGAGGSAATSGASSGAAGAVGGGAASSGGSKGGSGGKSGTAGASEQAGSASELGGAGGSEPHPNGSWWKPSAGLTWQWQLSEAVTEPLDVDVYDIDWEADAATVKLLHDAGSKVICYVSVGSWEDFRPDAADFPAAVIGNDYDGWPGEKYVDIRSEALRAVMAARFDACAEKGFDAVEPDNMDVFELGDESGFPLSEADGLSYAAWLAEAAHARGMGIGQKNAGSISAQIAESYDWALTESCFSDGDWCGDVELYVQADKPVFMCEYESGSFQDACEAWQGKKYSPILKSLELDAPLTVCP